MTAGLSSHGLVPVRVFREWDTRIQNQIKLIGASTAVAASENRRPSLMKEVFTMNQTIHLRVISPLLALDATADYVTIPETAMIETTDDLAEPGFHRVRYLGESLLVFTRDIQERTQQISGA